PIKALDEVTVTAPNRAVGLLGPNGAGKTTLIRILMGIIQHTSGSASVLGLDITESINEIRDRVGYSPEFVPMIPDVSAMKYVTFLGKLSGLTSIEAAQRAHDTLHYVGLDEERYRPLREFSQGMMQKCKLAAALVHDPEFVILDEPTDGLDPTGRQQMLELIQRLYKEEGKKLLVSSHLLFDVEKVCDYVIVLGRGQVITTGDMSEMLLGDSEELRIIVTGDADKLANKLNSLGLKTSIDGSIIDVKRVEDIEIKILRAVNSNPNVSLRYFGRKTRSLEDVFLTVVNGEGL
ncbi:MAG: ABC transporter ATP-binding protein, partial [Candidatus Thorarchaeota archaeon]